MTPEQRTLAKILVRTKILGADGQAFEDLFTNIQTRFNSNFRQIKPQGQYGDRKNDGYDHSAGLYYQVFAPENISKSTSASDAVEKAERDFAGLKSYWDSICPIRHYRFVLNDKYKGSFPEIEQRLSQIQKQHQLISSSVFLAKDLEDAAMSLNADDFYLCIGFVPIISTLHNVEFGVLGEVIEYVSQNQYPLVAQQALIAPDFNKKIIFNNLSSAIGILLNNANFQRANIDEYFRLNSSFAKQHLRDLMNALYKKAIIEVPQDDPTTLADRQFWRILENCIPPRLKQKSHIAVAQAAALVLIAYYFESCDIFEEPKTITTTT